MSTNPSVRDTDLAHLHPVLRAKVVRIQAQLAAEGIPLRLFEGYRSPFRQKMLFDKHDGTTNANAWQSNHNYGMAVDFVFYNDTDKDGDLEWNWNSKGQYAAWWKRFHELGRAEGLIPLSFEMPHLEMQNASWRDLYKGKYPTGGDRSWAENLSAHILQWGRRSPTAPPIPDIEQPRPKLGPGAPPPLPPIAETPTKMAAFVPQEEREWLGDAPVAKAAEQVTAVVPVPGGAPDDPPVKANKSSLISKVTKWAAGSLSVGAVMDYITRISGLSSTAQVMIVAAVIAFGLFGAYVAYKDHLDTKNKVADPNVANVK